MGNGRLVGRYLFCCDCLMETGSNSRYGWVLILGCLLGAHGCSTPARVPIADLTTEASRPSIRTVQPGETLYGLAWEEGIDYRVIARANGLKPPYRVVPGQRIRMSNLRDQTYGVPLPKKVIVSTVPTKSFKGTRLNSDKGTKGGNAPLINRETTQRKWLWPAQGKVLRSFTARDGSNGIEISGKEGALIRASANGKVVYAGSGLRGYGNLLILKHDNHFLSAYAHNRRLLVKENDTIPAGMEIAEMGKKDTGRARLHFEIRKNGKPVNPLNYLPVRTGD